MRSIKAHFPLLALALAMAGAAYLSVDHVYDSDTALALKIDRAEAKADQAIAAVEYADRVVDLPEDANAWHVTVFTNNPPTARDLQILSWFDADPQLHRLKTQTHFHHFTPASSLYSRYTKITAGGLPAIAVQDAAGAVVYKASGDNAPKAPWPLVNGIKDCIRSHCPHLRPCPKPPEPPVQPTPEPAIPDVVGPPADAAVEDKSLLVAAVASAIVFVSVFLANKIRSAQQG